MNLLPAANSWNLQHVLCLFKKYFPPEAKRLFTQPPCAFGSYKHCMKRTLKIAAPFGIPLRLHWTFGLVFLYVFYLGWEGSWDWFTLAWAVAFVLALFLCVTLHEYGHALMARRFGVATQDILLSPIGGVARLDHIPSKPSQELLIALAGPAVNVVIAGILSIYLYALSPLVRYQVVQSLLYRESNYFLPDLPVAGYWLIGLLFINVMLALFNLLPAFPMDGGRVLRALLAMRWRRYIATLAAARAGQLFALAFAGWGIVRLIQTQGQEGIFYLFIGGFVFITAQHELKQVAFEDRLERMPTSKLMRKTFTPLFLGQRMAEVQKIFGASEEKSFLVFNDADVVIGILPEFRIQQALEQGDYDAPVARYMVLDHFPPLWAEEPLAVAYRRLLDSASGALPVYDRLNCLVGVMDISLLDHLFHKKTTRQ